MPKIVLESLIQQVGSKYALASLCAKRARDLNAGAKVLIDDIVGKSDAIALKEIQEGLVLAVPKPKVPKPEAPPIAEAA
jgi:DNA-directed RNA polymerase omega subunit